MSHVCFKLDRLNASIVTKETNVKLALEWVVTMVTCKFKMKKLSPANPVNLVINRFSKITFGNIDDGDGCG